MTGGLKACMIKPRMTVGVGIPPRKSSNDCAFGSPGTNHGPICADAGNADTCASPKQTACRECPCVNPFAAVAPQVMWDGNQFAPSGKELEEMLKQAGLGIKWSKCIVDDGFGWLWALAWTFLYACSNTLSIGACRLCQHIMMTNWTEAALEGTAPCRATWIAVWTSSQNPNFWKPSTDLMCKVQTRQL